MNRVSEEVRKQIRLDREGGLTYQQIMDKYHLRRSTAFYAIRGCDSSRVDKAAPRGKKRTIAVQHKSRPPLSKTDLGEACRQMIFARLMMNGVKVFRPMSEDTSVDLLVLKSNNNVAKCQCKYLYPGRNGCHVLACSASGKGSERKKKRHIYSREEVDFFIGYCLDDDSVYVVPIAVTAGRSMVSLWIAREPIGRCRYKILDTKSFKNKFDLLF